MKTALVFALAALAVASVSAKVHYKETFDSNWASRWVQSEAKSDYGKFVVRDGLLPSALCSAALTRAA